MSRRYEIIVAGELGPTPLAAVPGFEARPGPGGCTSLVGRVQDQAALQVTASRSRSATNSRNCPASSTSFSVHHLNNGAICRDLEATLEQLPDNVRFVLSSRWDLLVRTCDLRLAGRLTGLRAHDLAFDVAEGGPRTQTAAHRCPDHSEQPTAPPRSRLAVDRDGHRGHPPRPRCIPSTHRDRSTLRSSSPTLIRARNASEPAARTQPGSGCGLSRIILRRVRSPGARKRTFCPGDRAWL